MNESILIVEDDEDILDLLNYTLSQEGYDVIPCINTSHVRDILDEEKIALILMDRNLPATEGSAYVSALRKDAYNHPVIFISAKNSSQEILEGFESGCDDYITKPFNIQELKARVKALLKRNSKVQDILKHKDISYHASSKIFSIQNTALKLTHLEHDLLLEFMKNPHIVLSRETLLENVWQDSANKQLKTVNVAIKRLKEQIDPKGDKEYIQAVRGEGYMFC